MTGFVGGRVSSATRDELLDALHQEEWYETERFEVGDSALGLVHHGERDPGGHRVWTDGRRAGVVDGAIFAPERYREDPGALFEAVLDDPVGSLPDVEGCFLLAAVDGATGTTVLAADKLGTRQGYYHSDDPLVFGTSVGALLPVVDDPTVDERAVSDMALIGQVWGDKTLAEEVTHLPSGSVLVDEADGVGPQVTRYWEHEFGQDESHEYVDGLVDRYRQVVSEMADTIEGEAGLWLSGGMDSRAMAAELARNCESLETYTYDANPPQAGNLKQAKQVAETLGIENRQVEVSADRFADVLDDAVALTSGMVGLVTFVNLSAAFNLPEDAAGVVVEACGQGGMMGDGIGQATIERASSPEEALYEAKHLFDVDGVRRVMNTTFDPMDTYREEVAKSDQSDFHGTVMDVYYRNYFARGDFASNPMARSQVGTRIPFAHADFLTHMTDMPLRYRVGAIPFTMGKIPYATAPLKLELVRRMNSGLEQIPYQRTKLPPERPLWQHGVGFVVGTAAARLQKKMTYGGRGLTSEWYLAGGPFTDRMDAALASAARRPYFDGDEIRRIQREHKNREANNMGALSGIATPELWIQHYVDP